MTEVHLTIGISLFALNLAAGAWGVAAWLLRRPTKIFWLLLRAAQVVLVIQVLLGALLLLTGDEATRNLHYLYGVLPLAITMVTEMMRVGAARQIVGDTDYEKLPEAEARALAMRIFIAETRVMALGCLIIAAIVLRAGTTSGAL